MKHYIDRLRRSKLVLTFAVVDFVIYSTILGCIALVLSIVFSFLGLPFWLGSIAFFVLAYVAYLIARPAIDDRKRYVNQELTKQQEDEDWLNAIEDDTNRYYDRLSNIRNKSYPKK